MENKNTTRDKIIDLIATICVWFISALFIWWGWSVLAPHINAPTFSYIEIFAMRMGLSFLMRIILQKN